MYFILKEKESNMNINPYSYRDDQGNWTNGKVVYVNELAVKKLIEYSDGAMSRFSTS